MHEHDHQPPHEAVDLMTAAVQLGITYDGVRRRLARHKLHGFKRDGRWFVYLPTSEVAPRLVRRKYRTTPDTAPDESPDSAPDAAGQADGAGSADLRELVRTLQQQVGFLQEQVSHQTVVIATLTQRIAVPELPGADTNGAVTHAPDSPPAPRRRSWRPSWLWLWRWPAREPPR